MTKHGTARAWVARTATAIAVIGSVTAVSAELASAQAAPAVTKSATVVKIVTRHHFGKILATTHGRALYIKPRGGCTGSCLTIWPPLLMPKGKTIPLGTHCLGTARFRHRLQVTYREMRLYTFANDSGNSVNGNNVGGFKVAKLVTRACPA